MGLCYVNAKWHGSLFEVMELGDFRQQLTACFHRDERLVSSDARLHLRVGWRAAKGLSEGDADKSLPVLASRLSSTLLLRTHP